MDQNSEKQFFDERGVTVTSSRFILPGQKTFAMSGVTAVRAARQDPSKLWPIIFLFIGGLFLVASKGDSWVFSSIMLAIGVLWLKSLKPMFFVVLSTASGEQQALQDRSGEWISKVVEALNECIVYRG